MISSYSLTPNDMAVIKGFLASVLVVSAAALGMVLARYGVTVISFAS